MSALRHRRVRAQLDNGRFRYVLVGLRDCKVGLRDVRGLGITSLATVRPVRGQYDRQVIVDRLLPGEPNATGMTVLEAKKIKI